MEILFVLTHAVLVIYLISIIDVSIPRFCDDHQIEKRSLIAALLTKARLVPIITIYISRTATALLGLFLR
jgi:hypothetical protein